MRDQGYYWCKLKEDSQWALFEWTEFGTFYNNGQLYHEKELFIIDENRVKTPDEQ